MIIGITGTQHGATPEQLATMEWFICQSEVVRVTHGDCIGVDEQSHKIAVENARRVTVFPPDDPKKRAWCSSPADLVEVMPERYYTVRNKMIVTVCNRLLVVPKTRIEERRGSGTWSTKRYAEKTGRPFTIIYPDGSTT